MQGMDCKKRPSGGEDGGPELGRAGLS
jgi:hypothetical protein